MISEVGSIDFLERDSYSDSTSFSTSSSNDLHEMIFTEENHFRSFPKNISPVPDKIRFKIENAAKIIRPMKADASVEVGGKVSWGGKEGVEGGAYVKGEAHDDKGNYVKVEIEQNTDGTGTAAASGGHKVEEK